MSKYERVSQKYNIQGGEKVEQKEEEENGN